MAKTSSGILLYRFRENLEVFLVHPGGPFWAKKDLGVWSIPKGEFVDEDPLGAARREFQEETGKEITGNFIALKPVRLKSGKMIYAFAQEKDLDEQSVKSNTFRMEWPPKSGKLVDFPEIDRGAWFDLKTANEKLNQAQTMLIKELAQIVSK